MTKNIYIVGQYWVGSPTNTQATGVWQANYGTLTMNLDEARTFESLEDAHHARKTLRMITPSDLEWFVVPLEEVEEQEKAVTKEQMDKVKESYSTGLSQTTPNDKTATEPATKEQDDQEVFRSGLAQTIPKDTTETVALGEGVGALFSSNMPSVSFIEKLSDLETKDAIDMDVAYSTSEGSWYQFNGRNGEWVLLTQYSPTIKRYNALPFNDNKKETEPRKERTNIVAIGGGLDGLAAHKNNLRDKRWWVRMYPKLKGFSNYNHADMPGTSGKLQTYLSETGSMLQVAYATDGDVYERVWKGIRLTHFKKV